MSRSASASPAIDLAKVLAAHLILFHHLFLYGPVPQGPLDWIAADGRLAVQVFLVIGGYLGAASMLGRLHKPAGAPLLQQAWQLIVQRARRLLPTYWLAAFAMLAVLGWLRWGPLPAELPVDVDPEALDLPQVAANLLLLQDVLGQDGLSAGFWYVAIDLQLYIGLVLLAMLCRALPLSLRGRLAVFGGLTLGISLLSLLWWNLDAGLDAWAPYFAGSYALGMLACVLRRGARVPTPLALGVVGAIGLLALVLAWRSRIAVATLTAMALCAHGLLDVWLQRLPARALQALRELAAASYPMFLLHYPLLVLVCASVAGLTDEPLLLAGAVLACWPLSVGLGLLVQRWMDAPRPLPLRAASAAA